MTELIATNISVLAGDSRLVDNASVSLQTGELVAILGPNGAGKTSLLRALLGLTEVTGGSALLEGQDVAHLQATERAKLVSYLPQRRPLAWPNKVRDIIALGRFAHGAALGRLSPQDAAAVADAIGACKLESLADRNADTLSGGEIARVHFARALAARTPLLIADEPTAALDPLHQLAIAQLMRDFVDSGGGALVVLHDVALAARFADRLIWMRDGHVVAAGSPADTLNSELMQEVYGVRAHIARDSNGFDIRVEAAL
ncbi:MAG: ABC transporter ATP-binding protein [Woeseiaceae bacterium]